MDIKTSIKSDHSAITLSINGVDDLEKGPNFWKFNANLVNDSAYCEFLTLSMPIGWKNSKTYKMNVSYGI